ncbi:MAG: AfsR/SARP family transcriptional regulator [Nocardioides sp.]
MHQLRLWGITRLEGETGVQSDFGGVKPRQLLEMLATRQDEPWCKDALAEGLWEGRPPSSFAATLESHISVARRHLAAGGVPRTALRTVHNGYVLTDLVQVDLTCVRDALGASLRLRPEKAFEAVEAVEAWRVRDLLASSPYSSHAIRVREEMRSLLSAALRHAAEGALLAGATDRALLLARRAQAEDPVSDATQQVVMRALLALDARCDALRDYADFRLRLREELGVEPSGTTQRIYLDLLTLSVRDDGTRQRLERSLLMRLLGQLPEDLTDARAHRPNVHLVAARSSA